jgi:uncharacterized membrane protein
MSTDKETRKAAKQSRLANLLQTFLQGIIVLAPIGVTIWAVLFLFNSVDDLLPSILHKIVPSIVGIDSEGNLKKIPGLGFLVVLVLVMFVGWVSSMFFFGKVVASLDKILEKTPGVKVIYTSVKDLMEAFAGNKKKFDKPVLVNTDGDDVWRVGFITQKSVANFGLEDHVAVYVPHSYAISGMLFFVPPYKIKPLKDLSAADAMKFVISGGVTEVKEHELVQKK